MFQNHLLPNYALVKVSLHDAYLGKELFLGQFKDNGIHGKGEMTFDNGDKYTGDWVEGKRTGQGVYIFGDGDRYEIRCSKITCCLTSVS
jgi:hypothetical protein